MSNTKEGSLELIIGPMFAGKSSALMATIKRFRAIGKKVLVITHKKDNRYSDVPAIVSHDRQKLSALAIENIFDAKDDPAYKEADVIAIEEAQFFDSLHTFVLKAVEYDYKHVIVCGLDGDVNRQPFGDVLRLIPIADRVSKLTALCEMCRDGKEAHFTAKRSDSPEIIEIIKVGASDDYLPVCRTHYVAMKTG